MLSNLGPNLNSYPGMGCNADSMSRIYLLFLSVQVRPDGWVITAARTGCKGYTPQWVA